MIKYYLPISSKCLAHYYASACISPSCYIENRPEDIQDKFKEYLLLTDKFGTKETNCCLEIVLTEEEISSLVGISSNWFVFEYPIPISRVKKIIFSSREQMDTTLTNIRMSTAFIPDRLGEVATFSENPSTDLILPNEIVPFNHSKSIKRFDRILGALALMNLSREQYMNYCDKFFETFSMFNGYINTLLVSAKKNLSKPLCSYLEEEGQFRDKVQQLEAPLSEELVYSTAKAENVQIDKNRITKVINLLSLKNWSYIYAFIYQYGVGSESKRKRIDSFIINNFKSDELLEKPSSDTLALLYGYNRGYSVFNNAYGLDANNKQALKFKMESRLDHYIIESVYQYVFHGRVYDKPFDYIDNWCPMQNFHKHLSSTDYVILDTIVIGKKKAKVFSTEYWLGFFQSLKGGIWTPLRELIGTEKVETSIKELANIINTDLKDEWNDKLEEINANYSLKLANKECQIESLNSEIKLLKQKLTVKNNTSGNFAAKFDYSLEHLQLKPDIPTDCDCCENSTYSIDDLFNLYDKYRNKNFPIDELKKTLKENNIQYSKSMKKEELARLLAKYRYKTKNE